MSPIATVKDRIANLEAEIVLLKQATVPHRDFGVDEANWKKMRSSVKKARGKLYSKTYG